MADIIVASDTGLFFDTAVHTEDGLLVKDRVIVVDRETRTRVIEYEDRTIESEAWEDG